MVFIIREEELGNQFIKWSGLTEEPTSNQKVIDVNNDLLSPKSLNYSVNYIINY